MVIKTHYTNNMKKTKKEIAFNLGFERAKNEGSRIPLHDDAFVILCINNDWYEDVILQNEFILGYNEFLTLAK